MPRSNYTGPNAKTVVNKKTGKVWSYDPERYPDYKLIPQNKGLFCLTIHTATLKVKTVEVYNGLTLEQIAVKVATLKAKTRLRTYRIEIKAQVEIDRGLILHKYLTAKKGLK
jgi:hypothetical protein